MHRSSSRLIITLLCILVTALGAYADPRLVVVLNSYHQGYEWTNAVNAGIQSVLAGSTEFELAFEYLDAQRTPAGPFDDAARLFRSHYARRKPAAIIAVDDDALRFLIEHAKDLFLDVPIVYCGINDITAYNPLALAGMTGITESPDIGGSLDLALRIFPGTTTILAIADTTTSGLINMGRFDRAVATMPVGITVLRSVGENQLTLKQQLGKLPPSSIVLYLSYLRTEDGSRMTVKESVAFVTGASKAPVFGCWDFIVEAGAFGGRVVSGRLQGIQAAKRATRLARGEPAGNLPQNSQQTYESMIRHDQLKRFKVHANRIPADVTLLGKPEPLPRLIVIGIISLIFIATLEGLTLILALRNRSMLAVAESRYRILAEQLPAIVYSVEFGRESRTSYVSPRLTEMLGYDPEDWMANPRAWIQAVHPDDRNQLYAEAMTANEAGVPVSFDYRAVTAKGEIKYIKNLRAYYRLQNGTRAAVGAWMDLTQERHAQESIQAALKEKELLLKEIHHRVKNNFQIVTSLLRLEYENLPDSPAHEALRETERRIFAMSLVHEQLYHEENLSHIDFKPYADRMGKELLSMTGNDANISFTVEGDELSLGIDKAVPLGLFLNEALMNAFKHAFPAAFSGSKSIHVVVRHGDEREEIMIRDSGIGFEPESSRTQESSPQAQTSLGLTLMTLLTDQLGGEMSITSEAGTVIRLQLPWSADQY